MRRWWILILIGWLSGTVALRAEEYTDPHEAGDPVWNVPDPPNGVRVTARARQSTLVRKGRFSERIDIDSPRDGLATSIETPIPPARVIDDLRGFLAVRSNRLGGVLAFRAVLPHERDPRTGQPLTFLIRGGSYRREDDWQEVVCSADERAVTQSLALVRQMINRPQLDTRDMYVDRLVFRSELRGGMNTFLFDDLQVTGLIRLRQHDPLVPVDGESTDERVRPAARMTLDQLLVDERPFFPRILPDHGESPGLLSASGFNTIWISNASDAARIHDLRGEGLSLMATPPRTQSDSGELIDPRRAVLAPFTPETSPIAFWYLGTHIPSASQEELASWRQQVASADRRYDRPIVADIAGNERSYSRRLSMTACSRPVLNTSWNYRDYHQWLKTKRQMCFPGSFFWTWIDIDAGVRDRSLLSSLGHDEHVVEPEQLRLQVYAALAAGCRGLGFWSRIPLDVDRPGREETRLMLAQLNREIELLSPILATGILSERTVTLEIDRQDRGPQASNSRRISSSVGQRPTNLLLPPSLQTVPPSDDHDSDRLEATVIMSGTTVLLLPLWYQDDAQYVPGGMSTREATVVVPGVPESASAWLITTHGLQNLDLQFANGGRRIRIPDFRMTSAVIVTSDRDQVRRLQAASWRMARDSTAAEVELSRAKLERVKSVERQLNELGVVRTDSDLILSRSEAFVSDAELSFRKGNYDAAFRDAGQALHLLRTLQRSRWEDACRAHSHPGASPYLYCYQTLPRHWQLMRMVGERAEDQLIAMLASGSFEQVQTLLKDGWQHSQFPIDGVKAAAELYPAAPPGMPGEYCLRLAAVPETNTNPPPLFEAPPVRYSTPRIPVQAGDVLLVTGWMRVKFPAANRLDRAMIRDNLTGENGSLRFGRTRDWQRFELLRVAENSGNYELSFLMEGLGEMQIDDVRIATLRTLAPALTPEAPVTPDSPTFRERFNDLFNRIPGVNRLPGFGEQSSRNSLPQP